MSWFGNFLGGAAGAVADITKSGMDLEAKESLAEKQRAAALEDHKKLAEWQMELQEKKAKALDEMKEQRKREQREKEIANQQEAYKEGDKIAGARDLTTATSKAPSLNEEGFGMVKSALSPADLEKYYGVKQRKQSEVHADAETAAMKSGAYDTMDAISKVRKETSAAEIAADKEDRAEQEAKRREKKDDNQFKIQLAQVSNAAKSAEASMLRAQKSGDAAAATEAKVSATQAVNSARDAMKEMIESGKVSIDTDSKTGKTKIIGSDEYVADYKTFEQMQRNAAKVVADKFSAKSDAKPKEDKPWTAPKNVDKNSALSQARAAINKGADPEKVKARLKSMGISTEGL